MATDGHGRAYATLLRLVQVVPALLAPFLTLTISVGVIFSPAAAVSTPYRYDSIASSVIRVYDSGDVVAAGRASESASPSARPLAIGGASTRVQASPLAPSASLVATEDSLAAARAARDAKAVEVGSSKATVTGGYGKDGVPRAGCNSNPIGCAEDDVARQIGGEPGDINFTEAIRPRTGEQVPICWSCQGKYDPSQFPPGTEWKPGGAWDKQ